MVIIHSNLTKYASLKVNIEKKNKKNQVQIKTILGVYFK